MDRRFSIAMFEYQRAIIILPKGRGHLGAPCDTDSDLPGSSGMSMQNASGIFFVEHHQQTSMDTLW